MAGVTWTSGAYEGSFDGAGQPAARLAEIEAFKVWRNNLNVGVFIDFQASAATCRWSDIEGPQSLLNSYSTMSPVDKAKLELCVLLLPGRNADGSADTTTNLATGATGAYNGHFTTLAQRLVAAGLANSYIRLGHEFNGTWYRWSPGTNKDGGNPNVTDADKGAAKYVSYWQQVKTVMRAAGHTGPFIWNPNLGISGSNFLAETAYPGDSYVDIIGVDTYDQSYAAGSYPYVSGETQAQREARQDAAWADILGTSRGLNYWANFARSHGKKIAYPEWGCFTRPDGHGGVDDPRYIQRMYDWFAGLGNDLKYESYFNFHASDGDHYLGPNATLLPGAAAKYLELWRPHVPTPVSTTRAAKYRRVRYGPV